jgi:hypothetical protein
LHHGIPGKHHHYRHQGEPVPNLRALEAGSSPKVVHLAGYRFSYVFDDVIRLLVGVAQGPDGRGTPLDFETEDGAEKVFKHWLGTGYSSLP